MAPQKKVPQSSHKEKKRKWFSEKFDGFSKKNEKRKSERRKHENHFQVFLPLFHTFSSPVVPGLVSEDISCRHLTPIINFDLTNYQIIEQQLIMQQVDFAYIFLSHSRHLIILPWNFSIIFFRSQFGLSWALAIFISVKLSALREYKKNARLWNLFFRHEYAKLDSTMRFDFFFVTCIVWSGYCADADKKCSTSCSAEQFFLSRHFAQSCFVCSVR